MKIRMDKKIKIIINKFINDNKICYIMSCFLELYPNKLLLALKSIRNTFDTYVIPISIKDFTR